MMELILLAAGNARRFGSNKLMWPLDGKPMILHTLEKLTSISSSTGRRLIIVTQEGPVAQLAADKGTEIVINLNPERGISSSIRCALDAVSDDAESAAFFVADQPWLEEASVTSFLEGFEASGKCCGCVVSGGETGNPCGFRKELFGKLKALNGDKGGKKVLLQHLDDCYFHEITDARQLTDIDIKP